jgi:hypothetical protein
MKNSGGGFGWVLLAIVIVMAAIVWVNVVWDGDYRCLVAECRIVKQ